MNTNSEMGFSNPVECVVIPKPNNSNVIIKIRMAHFSYSYRDSKGFTALGVGGVY